MRFPVPARLLLFKCKSFSVAVGVDLWFGAANIAFALPSGKLAHGKLIPLNYLCCWPIVVACLSLVGGVLLELPAFCGFLNLPQTFSDNLTPSLQVATIFSNIASFMATDGLLILLPFVLDIVGVVKMQLVSPPVGESVSAPFSMQFSPSICFDLSCST